MATIKQYFADAKITPSDRGTEAWQQAGRRLSAYAEQTAQGLREQGQDIAKLWNTAKYGADLSRALAEGSRGGGGGLGRGNVHDALDFGARSGWGNGAVAGVYGQNESSVTGYGRSGGYNARAAREISNGAANLPSLISRVMDGQGLTDQQYQELGTSPRGAAALFNARNQGGMTGLYGKDKGAIEPNAEPTEEQAAQAGFNVDPTIGPNGFPTTPPPGYPVAKGGAGMPDIFGPDTTQVLSNSSEVNPSGYSDNFPTTTPSSTAGNVVKAVANTAASAFSLDQPVPPGAPGVDIWNAIGNAFTPSPDSGGGIPTPDALGGADNP